MKINKQGLLATPRIKLKIAGTTISSGGPVHQPGPLPAQVQYLKEGDDTVLAQDQTAQQLPTRSTQDLVTEFITGFQTNMFDKPGGLTKSLITNFSTGVELFKARMGVSANAQVPTAPDNADTELIPAVESILKCAQVLQSEDPALLRNEDLDQIQQALGLVQGYDELLQIADPLVFGLTACKIVLQVLLAEFCQRIYRDGSSAIKRNRILLKGTEPLQLYIEGPVEDAQDTKHLKAQVAHETEAETLERVKGTIQGQGTPGTPAAGGTNTGGSQGTQAPGQNPAPPSAGPALPDPKYPKPKRRSSGAAAKSKKKSKPT